MKHLCYPPVICLPLIYNAHQPVLLDAHLLIGGGVLEGRSRGWGVFQTSLQVVNQFLLDLHFEGLDLDSGRVR